MQRNFSSAAGKRDVRTTGGLRIMRATKNPAKSAGKEVVAQKEKRQSRGVADRTTAGNHGKKNTSSQGSGTYQHSKRNNSRGHNKRAEGPAQK